MLHTTTDLKTIFFDLDNVLVFSEFMHFQAWQALLKQWDIDLTEDDFQETVGVSDLTLAKRYHEIYSLHETPLCLWEFKRNIFLQLSERGFEYPVGRNVFLDKIAKQYPLGLVSSSNKMVIQQILKIEQLTKYFNFIIGQEDCDRHKPDPLPYLMALERAQVEPHQALVIEDSKVGILSAKAAGVPVIGILKDQQPDQILEGVDYFRSFDEVDRWLSLSMLKKQQG